MAFLLNLDKRKLPFQQSEDVHPAKLLSPAPAPIAGLGSNNLAPLAKPVQPLTPQTGTVGVAASTPTGPTTAPTISSVKTIGSSTPAASTPAATTPAATEPTLKAELPNSKDVTAKPPAAVAVSPPIADGTKLDGPKPLSEGVGLTHTPTPTPTAIEAGYTGDGAGLPGVVEERGTYTTDRDPSTGFVINPDANNQPESAVAKTWVAEDGSVHYTGHSPDGSPLPPYLDHEGWPKLSASQQEAAMRDYITQMEARVKENQSKPGGDMDLSQENYDGLDDDGRLALAKSMLPGANGDGKPRISVDEHGNVRMTEKDADGNLIPPYEQEGWKDLTPEQRDAAMKFYGGKLEEKGKQQTEEDSNYLGYGISKTTWDQMTDAEKADLINNGIKPPVHGPNGSTYTRADKSTYTVDLSGAIKQEVAVDGTVTDYGTGKAKTIKHTDGYTERYDSDGNALPPEFAHDSAAETKRDERAALGYTYDGKPMTLFEQWCGKQDPKIDPKTASKQVIDVYQGEFSQAVVQGWSEGEAYARAAVSAGFITYDQYKQMRNAPYAHSFGAWAIANKDIVAALLQSNIDIVHDKSTWVEQPGKAQQGSATYSDDADSFFTGIRNLAMVDPHSLEQVDFDDPANVQMSSADILTKQRDAEYLAWWDSLSPTSQLRLRSKEPPARRAEREAAEQRAAMGLDTSGVRTNNNATTTTSSTPTGFSKSNPYRK